MIALTSLLLALTLALLPTVLSQAAIGSETQEAPVPAAIVTPAQALERLFTAETVESDWFAPSFLQQVPLDQIQSLLATIGGQLGPLRQVDAHGEGFALTFERGAAQAQISLDGQGRIASLLLSPADPPLSLEEAAERIAAFPGEASLLVLGDGRVLAAVNPEQPLAVGSAFKLAVLAALRQAIAQGEMAWDDVVTLEDNQISLPSGLLQTWPVGSHLTLETLATLMIAVSDNTATDALIHILGQEAIAPFAPNNVPLLTTRAFFALKNPVNGDLLAQYRQGDAATRETLLFTLADAPLPPTSLFTGEPVALDVEWFFSTQDLCGLMDQVAGLPLMGVNPGVASPSDWQAIAFKGGSEPGVLNLTTQVQHVDGRTYCVAATWNDATQPLDEAALTRFYGSVLAGLVHRENPAVP
ncbi:MAG: serine hydrolase [Cyanobacteria bacterium]|nr:serine hydrolase [Cyanobacteriota bacterium]MDA0866488.1 serine hydrolase [Cyanobacteriota bacterium]